MTVSHLMTIILCCLATALAQDTCPAVSYAGRFSPDDHVKDQALVGYSYRNITNQRVENCFQACIGDCRCVSYQINGSQCELIDEDRHTAPNSFTNMRGYKYFELKHGFSTFKCRSKVSCPPNGCLNGCCLSNPCLNGGTCIELCEDPKRKFKCNCIEKTFGRVCEKYIGSCAAMSPSLPSGWYKIFRPPNHLINVYCDFHSEPDFVWTLIESFAYENKTKYSLKSFVAQDFPENEDRPNWLDYRLSIANMKYINENSSHWRVTCKFDSDGVTSDTDYLRTSREDFDILNEKYFKKNLTNANQCVRFEVIRAVNSQCKNCTGRIGNYLSYHPFLYCYPTSESSLPCDFDSFCKSYSVFLFGASYKWNSLDPVTHACASSPNSTTSWWLGTKWFH